MEDGKGDSCPAEILRVTFYKFSFLTILKFWFIFLLKIQFHIWTKMFSWWTEVFSWWSSWWTLLFRATARPALLGDDPLGEQKCSLAELLHATFFYKFICKLQWPIVGNITFALRSFLVFHLFLRNFGFNGYFPFLLGPLFWSPTKNHLINWQATR